MRVVVGAAAALCLLAGPAVAERPTTASDPYVGTPGVAGTPGVGGTGPVWAPVATAAIRPGARLGLPIGGTCTANFVFVESEPGPDGVQDVYLGSAAHCFPAQRKEGGVGTSTFCDDPFWPLGTPVSVEGAREPGVLAYHSGLAMQAAGETDPQACANNDFALVRLHPDDVADVNPTVPVFGGPTGVDRDWAQTGDPLQVYGRSGTRGSAAALYPLRGAITDPFEPQWDHYGYVAPAAYYGDSGSPALTTDGKALGVLVAIVVSPTPGGVAVVDLAKVLDYATASGGPRVELALGTEPHVPDLPQLP